MQDLDRQLRCFVCIAQSQSLSRASVLMDCSQPWLSKQLALLETAIGQSLFVRTGRGVSLTEAGQRLRAVVEPAFAAIDRGVDEVCQVQGVTQGTVRLAAIHTLSYYFMSDVIARFVGIFPRANLSLMGRSSPEVVALVENGQAHLGFVYDAAVSADTLKIIPLFDDEMCLILPVKPYSAPDVAVDLRAQCLQLVAFPKHYALRRMLEHSAIEVAYVAEAETVDAMLKLVSDGVGVCILPNRIPDALLADYQLIKQPIAQPLLRRRVVAVVRHDKPLLPLVQDFLQCAQLMSKPLAARTK